MKNFIKEYINKITKNDLFNLLKKKDIYLSDNELDYLYNCLKKNWYDFLYNDPTLIFNNIKNNINNDNYNKLYNLYIWAKEKYSFYL